MLIVKTKSRRFQPDVNKAKYPEALNGMKDLLQQMAAYNIWANQKLMEMILSLPEEKQMAEIPSSFKSLYKTVLHMWDAESAWWQRMKLQERLVMPSENFNGNMKDLVNGLMQQSNLWLDWVSNASDIALDHVFHYQNSKKEQFKQPIYQMMLHVFNHGTYHRGQLINMLRQLGVEKLPQTDFIIWSRKK
ncbi:MAG: DinB family protein [Chitinophagaceae bacterium]